ncbi:MAG: hypothetical protein LBO78_01235 [Rickettsiales bacterium]|jgi:hypothetical protein|nr:hypothetical protein [Rickettsiales bacterium]
MDALSIMKKNAFKDKFGSTYLARIRKLENATNKLLKLQMDSFGGKLTGEVFNLEMEAKTSEIYQLLSENTL